MVLQASIWSVLPDTPDEVIEEDSWPSDLDRDALRLVQSFKDYLFSEQIAFVDPTLVELDLVYAIEDKLPFRGEVYELCPRTFLVIHLPVAFNTKVFQLFEVVIEVGL